MMSVHLPSPSVMASAGGEQTQFAELNESVLQDDEPETRERKEVLMSLGWRVKWHESGLGSLEGGVL